MIESGTVGTGNAGTVTVGADSLVLDNATIGTDAFLGSSGNAGSLTVTANAITAANNALIRSSTVGAGNGGSVAVTADTIALDTALIGTDALNASTGNAGTVTVSARSLTVGKGAFVSSDAVGSGNAGAVTVRAATTIVDGGSISSQTYPNTAGNAGTVAISGGSITVRNQGVISSSTYGSGNAGAVDLGGTSLAVESGAFVTTFSNVAGRAGQIALKFDRIALATGGQITSDTFGSGNAGNIRIDAADLSMTGVSNIASRTYSASTGNAGSIAIAATRTIALDGRSTITTSTASPGTAGAVSLSAPAITIAGGAVVSSNALDFRLGTSGSVTVAADSLALTGGAQIQTTSNNINPAGSVDVAATDLRLTGASSAISTANVYRNPAAPNLAQSAYGAGALRIAATTLTLRDGASITSNSMVGPAGDLTIAMPFKAGLILLSSAGTPSTITTSSGPGTGGRITIASPLAVISNGGAIRAQGAQGGANVLIASNYFIGSADRSNVIAVDGAFKLDSNIYDVSNGTAVPSLEFLDASRVLSGQCAAARARGVTSRLSARATGPYAIAPSDPAPAAPGGCQ